MTDITENDTHELWMQIKVLREEFKEIRVVMDEHKKMGAAIYQKIQGALKIMEGSAAKMEASTNKVVVTHLARIQPEIQRTINEGMLDGREHFAAIAEKVGNQHHQEMKGLERLLPVGCALIGILASLIGSAIVYFLMPKIDKDTIAQLQTGAFFERVWPELSQNEQDKLKAIAEGRVTDKLNKKSKKT